MKKIILSIFCFTSILLANAQSPTFQWAKNIGGYSGAATGNSLAKDNAGNLYTTGSFAGRVDFDLGPNTYNLNSAGGNDAFILKTDAASNLIWAKQLGGTLNDNGNFITLDASGNIFITGSFSGTVDFDPGPGIFNLTSAGGTDAFVLKLDAAGNFIMVKQLGGSTSIKVFSIALDVSGNIHLTGSFSGTADFDPGPGIYSLTSIGVDAFVSKLDASGNFVWAKKIGANMTDFGWTIAVDAAGNVYTGGQFASTVDFDPDAGTFSLTAWATDAFFLKLNASGNFVWAKSWGGSADDDVKSLVIDASGFLYLTGRFFGSADFDPGTGSFYLTSNGVDDAYISKLDAAGNFIWARKMGGTDSEDSRSIALDNSGNIYTTGFFQGYADFDPGPGIFYLIAHAVAFSPSDIFISKLDASGNFVWAKGVGGNTEDWGHSVLVDGAGNVVVTGFFRMTADFDPGAAVYNLTTLGDENHGSFFLLKLNASGNFVWAKNAGSGIGCFGNSVTVDVSGNVITTGNFFGKVDFDPGAGVSYLITDSINRGDVFISKLNSAGNFLWAKQIGGITDTSEEGKSVTTDAAGNIYITGTFRGTADFDPGAGTYSLTASGKTDNFICKFDASGNFVWAKKLGGADDDVANSIRVDGSGNVYTIGYFRGTADFDPGPGTFSLSSFSSSSYDIFVCKLNASGNFVWAYRMGAGDYDIGNAIALDGSGNVYTTGYFSGTVDFDPGAGTFNLTAAGGSDIFITKTDGSANFIWTKQMSGTSNEGAYSIAVDGASNVYTTGAFNSTVDFDPGPGTYNLNSGNNEQIFISKLDASGNFAWAKQLVGDVDVFGNSIAVDAVGSVYTTGRFSGITDFDPGPGTFNLTASVWDVFISKLDASGNFVWAGKMGGNNIINNEFGYSIAVDAAANIYTTGVFYGTADFDPDAGVFNITPIGDPDMFIHKMSQQCVPPGATSLPFGSTIVCRNTTGNLFTVPAVAGATSYTWTAPTGATISSGQGTNSVSINFGSTAVSGNICVYASNGCGNSSTACKAILVVTANPTTPSSITGTLLPCANSNGVAYSCPVVTNASSYNWIVPATATIASGQGTNSITVNFGSTFTSGNIQVRSVNCYGVSSYRSITVRGKPSTPGTIAGSSTGVCAGTNGVAYSIVAVTGASTYTWTAPLNATIASGQGTTSVTVNYNASFTSGTLSVTAGNVCGNSAARTLIIYSLPTLPGTIVGQVSGVCAGTNGVAYTIPVASGATSYLWTAPPNATIATGQGTTAVTVNYSGTFITGTLSVRSVNACGTSAARTLTVNSIPAVPGAVTGQVNGVCAGTNGVPYSIAVVTAATSYLWTAPTNATIASGQGTTAVTVNYAANFTSGTLTVRSVNACGNSGPRNVSIKSVPITPGTITGAAGVCANQLGVPYSIVAIAGATTYNWVVPAGATVASGQGTRSITVNYGSTGGSLKVQSGNACGFSTFKTMTIGIVCREGEMDLSDVSGFTLYPNPFVNEFNFSSENNSVSLNIYDVLGSLVETHDRIIPGQEIKCGSMLTGGVYFVEIISGDDKKVLRLVKSE